jgi:hypothetical protein
VSAGSQAILGVAIAKTAFQSTPRSSPPYTIIIILFSVIPPSMAPDSGRIGATKPAAAVRPSGLILHAAFEKQPATTSSSLSVCLAFFVGLASGLAAIGGWMLMLLNLNFF